MPVRMHLNAAGINVLGSMLHQVRSATPWSAAISPINAAILVTFMGGNVRWVDSGHPFARAITSLGSIVVSRLVLYICL
jgi:hypothetical protein